MSDLVEVKFKGNLHGFKVYRGDGLVLHADPKKNQTNKAEVTVVKANQLFKDFPGAFEVGKGKKLYKEYDNKMVEEADQIK